MVCSVIGAFAVAMSLLSNYWFHVSFIPNGLQFISNSLSNFNNSVFSIGNYSAELNITDQLPAFTNDFFWAVSNTTQTFSDVTTQSDNFEQYRNIVQIILLAYNALVIVCCLIAVCWYHKVIALM